MLEVLFYLLVYAIIGCALSAAYRCRYADKDGWLSYRDEEKSLELGVLWPIIIPLWLIFLVARSLSNFMYRTCFRYKHGKYPKH